jgi:3-dehydroquinate dehydratase-1
LFDFRAPPLIVGIVHTPVFLEQVQKLCSGENRLLSKFAAGSAGEGASAHRQGVYKKVLDAASTEATLSCPSVVEFSKKSIKDLRGIDLLELRLDALPWFSMPVSWPLPVIATARHPAEGGLNNLSLSERQQLLERSLPSVAAIDIELQSAQELASTISQAHQADREVILSFHDFKATPSISTLKDLASRAHNAGATLLKVATATNTEEELGRLLAFQQLTHPLPVATMGLGPLGKISRLCLAAAGTALIYGWLDQPLAMAPASTQWSARELTQLKEDCFE